ncbi:MAG: hypothetical protein NTZ32_15805 [Planctomycetales bacterium]|nr:hypothetical protein [Planctomycetales bacterium]
MGAVVEAFYDRVLVDAELQSFFSRTNLEWLKGRQKQYFGPALGVPDVYQGASDARSSRYIPD